MFEKINTRQVRRPSKGESASWSEMAQQAGHKRKYYLDIVFLHFKNILLEAGCMGGDQRSGKEKKGKKKR